MTTRCIRIGAVFLFAVTCWHAAPASAVDTTWTALGAPNPDDWQDNANWSANEPGSSDMAHFTTAPVTTVRISVPVAEGGLGNQNANALGMTFSGGDDFTFISVSGAGGTLYVRSGGITVEGGDQTFNLGTRPSSSGLFPVVNNGAGLLRFNSSFMVNLNQLPIVTVSGDGDVQMHSLSRRYANQITNMDVVKNGAGTLTIVGAYASQGSLTGVGYSTGTTTINAGTISINNEANLGGNPGGYFNSGGTWVPGSFDADALLLDGGTLQATASFAIDDSNRGITLGALGGTFEVTGANTLTIDNAIAGAGGLTKTGTGTLALTNTGNTYSGDTTILGGTLAIGANNTLPTTTALVIGNGSAATGAVDLSNYSQQVGSLSVLSNTATANTITIGTGQTLTVAGDVTIGPNLTSTTTTKLNITGDGSLVVNAPSGRFQVGGSKQTSSYGNVATLDMSGLAILDASVDVFRVGDNGGACCPSISSTAILADTSTITATNIQVYSLTTGTQTLRLGSIANTLNANTITVSDGGGRSSGALLFNEATGSVTIRAKDGTGRANLYLASGNSGTGGNLTGTADFAGHSANLLLNILGVGNRAGGYGANGNGTGTLSFDTGTLDVTTVQMGRKTGGGAGGTISGTLNLGGGTVTIGSGGIDMGRNTTSAGAAVATINVSGAADVDVGGNITMASGSGTNSATINQTGGTVDVTGSVTDGDGTSTLNVDNGTMTVGTGLTVDNLRVGVNGGSATLTVSSGTVQVGASGDLHIGYMDQNLSANTAGTLNLSGATQFTANLDSLTLGYRPAGPSNAGRPQGTLILAETNDIDATTILISESEMWSAPLKSTLTLGTTNNIKTDLMTIGGYRGNAEVTFAAPSGTLNLTGSSGAAADLRVGYARPGTGDQTTALLDLTGGTFNATLDELTIAYKGHRSQYAVYTRADMLFDAGNVTANNVTIGWGSTAGDSTEGRGIGTLTMGGGSFAVANDMDLGIGTSGSQGTFTVTGGTATVAGDITDGVGSSTVDVSGGTLSVAGTIGVDSLTLDGTGIIDASTINVASGATFDFLGGTLAVDNFNGNLLQQGGTLAPGNSPGTTTVNGDYTLGAAGTLEIEIEGTTPGTGYDQVIVNGAVDLAGDLSVLVGGYSTTPDDLFWILLNDGTDPITGQFASFPEKAPVRIDGRTFYVYYDADFDSLAFSGGNDVLLTSVPEPSTVAMLLGLGLLGLLGYMRRRK